MTDVEIEKMSHMQQRLLLLLGYTASFIAEVEIKSKRQAQQYRWLMDSIQNIVYLDKPFEKIP